MQTKDILTAWSKDKHRLFMHQRYESNTPTPCEVVGFITEPAVTTGKSWDRHPERKWVEVRMFSPLDYRDAERDEQGNWVKPEGRIERVPARTLTESFYPTWVEYAEGWHTKRTKIAERDAQREQFRENLTEISDALGLGLRVGTDLYGEVCVKGDLNSLTKLVGTLKDAKLFYDTLVDDITGKAV